VIFAPRVQAISLRFLVLIAGTATAAAALAPPIRADVVGNAFLAALTNAGVPYSEPATATALGESVCPMLFLPGASFDSIVATMADSSGMSREVAGTFTIIAIGTYCPPVLAPLLSLGTRAGG
jgi:Protein of unknown function (DUF732)